MYVSRRDCLDWHSHRGFVSKFRASYELCWFFCEFRELKRVCLQAQEDAEVLRSLVEPLEEEIKALKEKLRSTDDELQKYVGVKRDGESPSCGKCVESELEATTKAQLVESLQKQVARLHEDQERESRLRGELEKEWQEKKEQHKEALTELTEQLKKSEEQMYLLAVSCGVRISFCL